MAGLMETTRLDPHKRCHPWRTMNRRSIARYFVSAYDGGSWCGFPPWSAHYLVRVVGYVRIAGILHYKASLCDAHGTPTEADVRLIPWTLIAFERRAKT